MALTAETALRKDKTTGLNVEMQHRHFAAIAAIIESMDECDTPRRIVADHFADELAKTNPRFDRKRFLKACGFYAATTQHRRPPDNEKRN